MVDASCSKVIVTGSVNARKAFVVPKVQVSFLPIVGYVTLAMLIRVERSWVDVDVGVKLLDRDVKTTSLQQFTDGGGNNSFTK